MQEQQQTEEVAKRRLTTGSTWLTAASLISRMIGVLYIIPWWRWIGDPETANRANALFNVGYNWYAVFLMIAIAGVPQGISRQIAYYRAKGALGTGKRLFKAATILMIGTGIVAGVLMYLLAPVFAAGTPTFDASDAVATIRSLVPALVVLPFLSISRGFFEGHQDMRPSALSQITEQVARVAYMLGAVYLLRQILDAPVKQAVVQSTFAAFIGALVALATLGVQFVRHPANYDILTADINDGPDVSIGSLIKEVIFVSIPFVVSGTITEFMSIIDTQTFKPIMQFVSNLSEAEIINEYGIFSANVRKLVTVLVSFATAISGALIPIISTTFTREAEAAPKQRGGRPRGQLRETNDLMTHGLSLAALILLPACLGMATVAAPAYQLIYHYDPKGTFYLQLSALSAIVQGFYFVLISTLQAMNLQKRGMFGIVLALIVKFALQVPLLALFGTSGAIYATLWAFVVPIVYYLYVLRYYGGIDFRRAADAIWPIVKSTLWMLVVIVPLSLLLGHVLGHERVLFAIVQLVLVAAAGALTYGLSALHNHSLDILFGEARMNALRRRLHFK